MRSEPALVLSDRHGTRGDRPVRNLDSADRRESGNPRLSRELEERQCVWCSDRPMADDVLVEHA